MQRSMNRNKFINLKLECEQNKKCSAWEVYCFSRAEVGEGQSEKLTRNKVHAGHDEEERQEKQHGSGRQRLLYYINKAWE